MSEKRRDHRGRILHNGEIQLSDGRYRFKYVDEMGKERCVYSWRLDHNDATPKGKRRTLLLREMEKKIQADHFEQIVTNGGNMTVLELVEKYTSTKTGVRPTTVAGYGTVINLLKKDTYDCGCRGMLSESNRKTEPAQSRTYGRWKKWILIL